MCLIAFAWRASPRLPLLLVANRDEFHRRPSAPLAAWADAPDILAGRDLQADGTWLGVSTHGRLAAVTNVRLPQLQTAGHSRGALVADYLRGRDDPAQHLDALRPALADYGPFNLLMMDAQQALYASNRPHVPSRVLTPGVYGLSNAALDTPWPKTMALRQTVADWIAHGDTQNLAPLFAALASETHAPDDALPNTGIGLAHERFLSPAFIRSREYGTRCSTVVMVDAEGQGQIVERRFGPEGAALGETSLRWNPEAFRNS